MTMMANQQMLDELYNKWFYRADVNRDGIVSGSEAVAFFMERAGLSQTTLMQIWDSAAKGAAALDHASFRRVCQLIWYAQNSGNQLPADSQGVVMKIISGMATLPPPRLQGLEVDVPPTLWGMRPDGIEWPPKQQQQQQQGYGASGQQAAGYAAGATGYSVPPTPAYSNAPSGAYAAYPTGYGVPPTGYGGGQAAGMYGAGATGAYAAGSTGVGYGSGSVPGGYGGGPGSMSARSSVGNLPSPSTHVDPRYPQASYPGGSPSFAGQQAAAQAGMLDTAHSGGAPPGAIAAGAQHAASVASPVAGAAQYAASQTGAAPAPAAGATGASQFPEIIADLAQKYAEMYKAANKDVNGSVSGQEVLRLLGAVPVDNTIKKGAWDLVAGTRAELNAHEFFTLLYLLDVHIATGSLPDALPGVGTVFPPNVHLCYAAAGLPTPVSMMPSTVAHVPLTQQNPVENLNLEAEGFKDQVWSMDKHATKEVDPLAAMPPVPAHATYDTGAAPEYQAAARLPPIDTSKVAAMSNTANAERLQSELKAAKAADEALFNAERAFATAQAENEFYMQSLQQLKLFKSTSERALLDTESRADAAQREAAAAKSRYEQMYADARSSASNHQELQKRITEAMGLKAEWESKVQVLQHELHSLAHATPEMLAQLDYEVQQIKASVAEAEAEKEKYTDQTAGVRAAKAQLQGRLGEVKSAIKTSQETLEAAKLGLDKAKQELDFTKTGEDAEPLIAALEEAASVYKSLFIKARGAGITPPKSAIISSDRESVWEKDDLIGAQDWMHFEDEGWRLVDEMPELPEGFNLSYFIDYKPRMEEPVVIVPVVKSGNPFVDLPDLDEEEEEEDKAEEQAAETAAGVEGDATDTKQDGAADTEPKDDAEAGDAGNGVLVDGAASEGNVPEASGQGEGAGAAEQATQAAVATGVKALTGGISRAPLPLDFFSEPVQSLGSTEAASVPEPAGTQPAADTAAEEAASAGAAPPAATSNPFAAVSSADDTPIAGSIGMATEHKLAPVAGGDAVDPMDLLVEAAGGTAAPAASPADALAAKHMLGSTAEPMSPLPPAALPHGVLPPGH